MQLAVATARTLRRDDGHRSQLQRVDRLSAGLGLRHRGQRVRPMPLSRYRRELHHRLSDKSLFHDAEAAEVCLNVSALTAKTPAALSATVRQEDVSLERRNG